MEDMNTTAESAADLLMLSGVVRDCPDCAAEQIFVPVDDSRDTSRGAAPGAAREGAHDLSVGAYCCTGCGAAILLDLFLETPASARRRRTA